MDTTQASNMAIDLMREHGLYAKGWGFRFDRAVKRVGQTNYNRRIISLSRPLVEINDESLIRNTILHEIAHVLAGHAAGHGPVWRAVHRQLGGTAERVASNAVSVAARYVGTCPNGHTSQRTRRSANMHNLSCGKCSPSFNRNYMFTWVDTQARDTVSSY